jgi:hypothetical protein
VLEAVLPGCGAWVQEQTTGAHGAEVEADHLVVLTGEQGAARHCRITLRSLADGAGCLVHLHELTAAADPDPRPDPDQSEARSTGRSSAAEM